jgi:hypothetical protein
MSTNVLALLLWKKVKMGQTNGLEKFAGVIAEESARRKFMNKSGLFTVAD